MLVEHTLFAQPLSSQRAPTLLRQARLNTLRARAGRLSRAGFEPALAQCRPKLTTVEVPTVLREQAAESTSPKPRPQPNLDPAPSPCVQDVRFWAWLRSGRGVRVWLAYPAPTSTTPQALAFGTKGSGLFGCVWDVGLGCVRSQPNPNLDARDFGKKTETC